MKTRLSILLLCCVTAFAYAQEKSHAIDMSFERHESMSNDAYVRKAFKREFQEKFESPEYWEKYGEARERHAARRSSGTCSSTTWNQLSLPNDLIRNAVGRAEVIRVNPSNDQHIYLGSPSGGLFKSTDGGQNWDNLTDKLDLVGLGIRDIIIDPNDFDKIYICTAILNYGLHYGSGIFYSDDGGLNWTPIWHWMMGSGYAILKSTDMHQDPFNASIIYAQINNRVYVIENAFNVNRTIEYLDDIPGYGGDMIEMSACVSWGIHAKYLIVSAASIYSTNARLYKLNLVNFFSSSPPSPNFTPLYSPPDTTIPKFALGFSLSEPDVFYAGSYFKNGADSFKLLKYDLSLSSPLISTNNVDIRKAYPDIPHAGLTNTSASGKLNGTDVKQSVQLVVSNTDPNVMYVAGYGVYKSIDGGQSFTDGQNFTDMHVDVRDIHLYQESQNGSQDVLYICHDGGASVTSQGRILDSLSDVPTPGSLDITQVFGIGAAGYGPYLGMGMMDGTGRMLNTETQEWKEFLIHTDFGDVMFDPNQDNLLDPAAIGFSGVGTIVCNWQKWSSAYPSPQVSPNHFVNYIDGRGNTNVLASLSNFEVNLDEKIVNAKDGRFGVLAPLKLDSTTDNQIGGLVVEDNVPPNKKFEKYFYDPQFINNQHEIISIKQSPIKPDIIYYSLKTPYFGSQLYPSIRRIDMAQGLNEDITTASIANACIHANIRDIEVHPLNEDILWVCFDQFEIGKKVYISFNGGTDWINITFNLDEFPLSNLLFDKVNGGILYAANELGVYYLTDADNYAMLTSSSPPQWQCFTADLPPTIVTDLEISYCEDRIYASTWGRGIWYNTPVKQGSTAVDVTSQHHFNTIPHNEGNFYFNSDYTFKAGTNVTFKDANIFVAPGKTIVIEPEAELHLDNTKVTNGCSKTWKGFEIHGDPTKSQFINGSGGYDQGYLELLNASEISNAEVGVRLGKENVVGFEGGILQSTGDLSSSTNYVRFKNCKRALEWKNYSNFLVSPAQVTNSSSKIELTEFLVDNDFSNIHGTLSGVENMIYFEDMSGIYMEGCRFSDERSTQTNPDYIAIEAIDVDEIYLRDYCSSAHSPDNSCPANNQQTLFNQLEAGILVLNGGSSAGVKYMVDNAIFENVGLGAYFEKCEELHFTRNELNGFILGLNLIEVLDLEIEENTFNGPTLIGASAIIVDNTFASDEEIYKNTFNDISYGIYATGINGGADTGIRFNCNIFNGNGTFDLLMDQQATLGNPHRGNQFNLGKANCPSIPNSFVEFTNVYSNNYNLEVYNGLNFLPAPPDPVPCVSSNVSVSQSLGIYIETTHCPSLLYTSQSGGGGEGEMLGGNSYNKEKRNSPRGPINKSYVSTQAAEHYKDVERRYALSKNNRHVFVREYELPKPYKVNEEVRLNGSSQVALFRISPNPSDGEAIIQSLVSSGLRVHIIDSKGHTQKELFLEANEAITWRPQGIGAGIYLVKATQIDKNRSFTRKLIYLGN